MPRASGSSLLLAPHAAEHNGATLHIAILDIGLVESEARADLTTYPMVRRVRVDAWGRRRPAARGQPAAGVGAGGRGDRQDPADRLDPQVVAVGVDAGGHLLGRRSSSVAAHCKGCSSWCSHPSRTARSRSACGHLPCLVMAPTPHQAKPPGIRGRFRRGVWNGGGRLVVVGVGSQVGW